MKTHRRLSQIVLLSIILLMSVLAKAQDNKPLARDLYIDFGFKYVPIDYIGGPALGLSYYSPDKKLSINLRYDIGFSIGKGTDSFEIDSIMFSSPQDHFSLQQFQVRTFLEAELLIWESNKNKLFASAGLGWNYVGLDQKYLLNESSGYYCLTVAAKYKISWFYIEPRVDIPVFNNSYTNVRLFPGSIALIYRFKPITKD